MMTFLFRFSVCISTVLLLSNVGIILAQSADANSAALAESAVPVDSAASVDSAAAAEELNVTTTEQPFDEKLEGFISILADNSTLKPLISGFLDKIRNGKKLIQMKHAATQDPLLASDEIVQSASNLYGSFPCSIDRSAIKPTSVHELKAGDIDVVAGLGDSITAGNGVFADSIEGLLTQWRGRSFSVGGDKNFLAAPTIPNFLRLGNGLLTGQSHGVGNQTQFNAHLNLAVEGARSADLLRQVHQLVNKMKKAPEIDFLNDWKLITVFIGGNDICECRNPISANEYVSNLEEALNALQAQVPKAFVNLVELLDVTNLEDLNAGVICNLAHQYLCPCIAFPHTDVDRKQVQQRIQSYQNQTEKLIKSGRYDTTNDFTVVLQPFLKNTKFPKLATGQPNLKYFAPDCFHFSAAGHAAAAEALWNNMIEPVGYKRTTWSVGSSLQCPLGQSPYLSTSRNSQGRTWTRQERQLGAQFGNGVGDATGFTRHTSAIVGSAIGLCVLVALAAIFMVRMRKRSGYQRIDRSVHYEAQSNDSSRLIDNA